MRQVFISGEVIIDIVDRMPKSLKVGKIFDINCTLKEVEQFFSGELLEISKNFDRVCVGTGYAIRLDNVKIHNYAKE